METENVIELVKPYLDKNDLTLYEVIWVKEYGFTVLRVSVDRAGGIDVESLQKVSKYLSPLLDQIDASWPEYMLEVCSPGAEKTLRDKDEVKASINEYINVRLPEMVYEGVLTDFDGEVLDILIDVKGRKKHVKVEYVDIKKIRLAVHV